jgi:hypothetical protein
MSRILTMQLKHPNKGYWENGRAFETRVIFSNYPVQNQPHSISHRSNHMYNYNLGLYVSFNSGDIRRQLTSLRSMWLQAPCSSRPVSQKKWVPLCRCKEHGQKVLLWLRRLRTPRVEQRVHSPLLNSTLIITFCTTHDGGLVKALQTLLFPFPYCLFVFCLDHPRLDHCGGKLKNCSNHWLNF